MSASSNKTAAAMTHHAGYLDGWRGLAILTLLIGHFFPIPGINLGTIGVNLFFVLSGFLMGHLLFEKREPIARFYRRRIARIIPAHITFLGTVTLAYLTLDLPVSARELLAALIFINNYIPPTNGPGTAVMPFGHIWSLCVEEHSYVVLSAVAIASRRKWFSAASGCGFLLAVCACAAAYYQWKSPPGLAFSQWLHTEVAAFGLLAASLWVAAGRGVGRAVQSSFVAPTLLLLGIGLHWWSFPLLTQRLLGVSCLVASLCLLTVTRGWFNAVLSWPPLRQLGLYSYSLYLWQQPFYLWSHQSKDNSPTIALGVALLCGLVSFYAVERPLRAYLNANWGGQEQRTTQRAQHQ